MSALPAFDSMVSQLVHMGFPRDKAEASVRAELGLVTPTRSEADDARDEKRIVAHADKQMRALGFRAINTSQPRHAKYITPGVPDRFYFHRARRLGLAWEAKTETGVQSPAQRDFQEDMDACGWVYILGTDRDLFAWLVEQRIAAWTVGDLLIALPFTPLSDGASSDDG